MLQAIKTKFGTVYIEELNSEREEEDRIKVFDSEKKYMDYFSIETINNWSKANNTTLEEEYQSIIKYIEESDTIERLVTIISHLYDLITVDWFEAADYLGIDHPSKHVVLEELYNNEFVNKIGNYYIVVCE